MEGTCARDATIRSRGTSIADYREVRMPSGVRRASMLYLKTARLEFLTVYMMD